ncbi:hypothetical protein JCM19238_4897 [Vibrio ponticus]|nr:hypothetical protein JCM19238_4897 [Vibrio ponticus]
MILANWVFNRLNGFILVLAGSNFTKPSTLITIYDENMKLNSKLK